MEKIEFGDVNKFLVSIGIILIAFSFITPYYFLKEDFGIYLEVSKFNSLQPHIQQLILKKQCQIALIQKLIPFASVILFLSGTRLSVWGLQRWFKRQGFIDERFDTELAKLKLEITSMTTAEVVEKARNEVQEIESNSSKASLKVDKNVDPLLSYLQIENRVYQKFKSYNSKHVDISTQINVGKIHIDILMVARKSTFIDRVIEVKYFKENTARIVLENALVHLSKTIIYYKDQTGRKALPVLLVIYEPNTLNRDELPTIKQKLLELNNQYPGLDRLKVEFSEVNEIEEFNVQELLKR